MPSLNRNSLAIVIAIEKIKKDFNLPVQDSSLPLENISVVCQSNIRLTITKINNIICNISGVGTQLEFRENLNRFDLYQKFENNLAEIGFDIIIILRGIENFLQYDNEYLDEFNELIKILNSYGVHVVCTCNTIAYSHSLEMLSSIDAVHIIKPLNRHQLTSSYYRKARELESNLPENFIEFLVDHQTRWGNYYLKFGIDLLLEFQGASQSMLEFWNYVELVKKALFGDQSRVWGICYDILFHTLEEDEKIATLIDNLCGYFISKKRFYISESKLRDLYELALESEGITHESRNIMDVINLLQELGVIMLSKVFPRQKPEYGYKKIHIYSLNWTRENVETAQHKIRQLAKRKAQEKKIRVVTDEELSELLTHLKFHINNKSKIKKRILPPIQLPDFDGEFHQEGLMSKIPCYVIEKEQVDIYFKEINYEDIQHFDFYHVAWLLECLHRYTLPSHVNIYSAVKNDFLKYFKEIVERSASIRLDISELFKCFIIDNLNRFFNRDEKIQILYHLLEINEDETFNYLAEHDNHFELFDREAIKNANELLRRDKALHQFAKQKHRKSRKKEYIREISHLTGMRKNEIQQLVKEKRIEFNVKITDDAILYLILKEKRNETPQCRGLRKDGRKCQNKTRHPSGYCPHHR